MLDKLTKSEEQKIEEVKKLTQILEKESDRGCCLLAVSFLDNELKSLLDKKLIGTKKFKKNIFNLNGPLGNFSSKIDLSFSIGLINNNLRQDIHRIRKIRNVFGHSYEAIHFDSPDIRSTILQLEYNFYEKNQVSIRHMFITAVTLILTEIHETLDFHPEFSEMDNKKYLQSPRLKELVRTVNEKLYNLSNTNK